MSSGCILLLMKTFLILESDRIRSRTGRYGTEISAIFSNDITEAQSHVAELVLFLEIQQHRQGDIRYTVYCLSRFFKNLLKST